MSAANPAPPSAVPHSGRHVGVPSGDSPGTVPGGAAVPTSPEQLVAQVASKSVGISDPLQTAHNGTHPFYAVGVT